jgi:type IV pilus assembly protein PilP
MSKQWMQAGFIMALMLGLAVLPLTAQEPTPTPEDDAVDAIGGEDLDVSKIDQILRGDQEVLQGEVFSYDPAGRRDPFKSLLEGIEEDEEGEGARPPGLPGMLIEELTVAGIIQTESGILAMVQGRDNLSYIIRTGTKLYNGEVQEILPKKVIFKQKVNDPKRLKPYEEVVREVIAE